MTFKCHCVALSGVMCRGEFKYHMTPHDMKKVTELCSMWPLKAALWRPTCGSCGAMLCHVVSVVFRHTP